jgi:hypothetical protein
VSSQRSQRPFEPNKHLTFTAMAPPKQEEVSQTARKTRVQTRSRGQVEEGEQQPPEIVNVDEIPSPHVSVGGLLEAGQRPKWKSKAFLGKKACTRKVTAGRKNNTQESMQGKQQLEGRTTRMHGRKT